MKLIDPIDDLIPCTRTKRLPGIRKQDQTLAYSAIWNTGAQTIGQLILMGRNIYDVKRCGIKTIALINKQLINNGLPPFPPKSKSKPKIKKPKCFYCGK